MVSKHALKVSRPTPKGEVEGSGPGGSSGPHPEGGCLQAHTWGGSPGPHLGGVSRPTPGGVIPSCTEADTPPADGYCCGWYASYWNAFLLYLIVVVVVVFFQVNEYMIFTVRASAWVDKIYYLICSKGNIVVGNTLEMASTQKTFSVALSREMVPSARIVAYYILNGEVVSDALNFHVNGTSLNPVEVRLITQRKGPFTPSVSVNAATTLQ